MSDLTRAPVVTRLQTTMDETSLWLVFALIGGTGASLLALGMLLRSDQKLTRRAVAGTALHSLLWGSCVFLMTADKTSFGMPFELGLAIFSGMGAASFIDVILLVVRQRLGISVTINPPSPPSPTPPPPARLPDPSNFKD